MDKSFWISNGNSITIPVDHAQTRVTCPTCGGTGQIQPAHPWEGPTPTERQTLDRWLQNRPSSSSNMPVVSTKKSSRERARERALAKRNPTVERLRATL